MDVMLHNHKAKDICRVPDGLFELCADISREVIRSQPEDIFCFIYTYLNTLLITRENAKAAVDVVQDVMTKSEQIVDILSGTGLDMRLVAAVAPRLKGAFKSYLRAFQRRLACGCVEPDMPPLNECGCEEIEGSKNCACDEKEPPKKPCGCDESGSNPSCGKCSVDKENDCIKTNCSVAGQKDVCFCGGDDESVKKLSEHDDQSVIKIISQNEAKKLIKECGCYEETPKKSCGCDESDNSSIVDCQGKFTCVTSSASCNCLGPEDIKNCDCKKGL